MFKQIAIGATLVYLLVVLPLVIESVHWPGFSVADQKKRLLKKLATGSNSDEETFRYLKKVRSKSDVTIGGTNVEQLLELYDVMPANCRDGSFAKRMKICDQAELEIASQINRYCESKLGDLVKLCHEGKTSSEARPTDAPVDQATVDFFKLLFRETGSKKLDEYEMKQLFLNFYKRYGGSAKMRKHCLVLDCTGKQSGPIGGEPAKRSDANQLETESQQPMWYNAYDMCEYYFANLQGHIDHGVFKSSHISINDISRDRRDE